MQTFVRRGADETRTTLTRVVTSFLARRTLQHNARVQFSINQSFICEIKYTQTRQLR